MGLNVGELIHEVTIQQSTDEVGSSQYPVEGWKTLCPAWMSREILRGSESMQAGQPSASLVTRWVFRYLEDMDPDLVDVPKDRRLLYQGRSYEIVDAGVTGRRESLWVTTIAHSKVAV
jgi:head-tail adaptor